MRMRQTDGSCCNGTGLADYAAVPCPNPDCTAPTGLKRGDIVKVDGVAKECTVRAVHSLGKDVLVTDDPASNLTTWVFIEQVTKVRDGD